LRLGAERQVDPQPRQRIVRARHEQHIADSGDYKHHKGNQRLSDQSGTFLESGIAVPDRLRVKTAGARAIAARQRAEPDGCTLARILPRAP
jgi:hypothetical protein